MIGRRRELGPVAAGTVADVRGGRLDPGGHGPPVQRYVRRAVGPVVRRLWPTEVNGVEGIAPQGPVIVCANHLSFMDSVLLMVALPRPVHFVGKAEYLDSWKTRRLFPALGMIPIDRASGARAMLALDAAGAVLDRGGVLVVYPEGTRSRDGRLHRGYTGAARLAIGRGCPVVAVGIRGTDAVMPPGAKVPRLRGRCSITLAEPIAVEARSPIGRVAARALTEQVMTAIAEITGQVRAPHYAPRPAPTTGLAVPVSSESETGADPRRRKRRRLGRNPASSFVV
jgi:1-acyl-sn-glycerol-3-phosphate acyltransferase